MAAAYRDAVHQLLVRMVERLRGAPVYGYLSTHVDPVIAADAPPDALARVVARYEAQVGAAGRPERVQAFRVEREDSVSVTVLYRLPLPELERVLARYGAAERALDITVVTAFPLLAASLATQGDVLVVEVAPGSISERAGIAPGDVIVRVGSRYVSSPEEYAAAANAAWASTRARRSLDLELVSRGQRVVRSLKKR
jgi:membrane-associated protease RseP (regulator of RpoE activity)